MLAIWSLVPLPFLQPAWTSGSSRFTYCWSLAWRILSITLLACEMSTIVQLWNEQNCMVVWAFFGITLLWNWNENWPFPVLWPLLSFPNLLTYLVQHFKASSFRVLNSSAGIPSLLLALGFPGDTGGKEPASQSRRYKRRRFDPWVGKIPQRRKWQKTPVFYLENWMDRGDWQATAH